MAELNIKGRATREVKCMESVHKFKFSKKGTSFAEATEKLDEEVEKFLSEAEEIGIKASSFKTEGIVSEYDTYPEETEMRYSADQVISFKAAVALKLTNAFLQMIYNKKLDVEYNERHNFSNYSEIHKDLLKEAIEDSRRKAEMIASCAGKKLLGIKKVDTNIDRYNLLPDACTEVLCEVIADAQSARRLSDDLQPAVSKETEDVVVVWEMEE